jgi:hypothetical protein
MLVLVSLTCTPSRVNGRLFWFGFNWQQLHLVIVTMSSETNDFSITKWKKNHNSLHAVEIAAYYFLMDFYNSAAFAVWVQIKRTIRQSTALQNNPKKFEKRSFYNKLHSTYTFWILNILHFLLKTLLQLYTAFARVTFRTRTWNSRENLV